MKNLPMSDIHYKNTKLLQRFLTPAGNIQSRERTGMNAKQQRRLSREIKRARHLALLPFATTV